jgi:hypothetical protein
MDSGIRLREAVTTVRCAAGGKSLEILGADVEANARGGGSSRDHRSCSEEDRARVIRGTLR